MIAAAQKKIIIPYPCTIADLPSTFPAGKGISLRITIITPESPAIKDTPAMIVFDNRGSAINRIKSATNTGANVRKFKPTLLIIDLISNFFILYSN